VADVAGVVFKLTVRNNERAEALATPRPLRMHLLWRCRRVRKPFYHPASPVQSHSLRPVLGQGLVQGLPHIPLHRPYILHHHKPRSAKGGPWAGGMGERKPVGVPGPSPSWRPSPLRESDAVRRPRSGRVAGGGGKDGLRPGGRTAGLALSSSIA